MTRSAALVLVLVTALTISGVVYAMMQPSSDPDPLQLPRDASLAHKLSWALAVHGVVRDALPQLPEASALLVTAHAALESGWGSIGHLSATRDMFNLTAGKAWLAAGKPVLHQENADYEYRADGSRVRIAQDWRKYASLRDAVLDYWEFLGASRYEAQGVRAALERADLQAFTRSLYAGGYYTLPPEQYLSGLLGVLTRIRTGVFQ